MTINITFEDFHGAVERFDQYGKERNTAVDINKFKKFVESQFREAILFLNKECKPSIQYDIKIITKSPNNNSHSIAYFRSDKSDDLRHYFAYYLEFAIPHFANYHISCNQNVKNVWIHELVHSLDYFKIKDAHFKIETYFKNIHFNQGFGRGLKSNSVYYVLNYLNKLRIEGIATFVEDLFDNAAQNNELWLKIDEMNIELYLGLIFNSSQNDRKINTDFINSIPYRLGKHLVLNCLFYIDEANADIYRNVLMKINNNENISLKDIGSISFLEKLLNLSLEDFIYINLASTSSLSPDITFKSTFLKVILNFLNNEGFQENNDFQNGFNLLIKILKSDKDNLQNLLKDVLGSKMNEVVIRENYDFFLKNHNQNKIFIQLLNKVYQNWEINKNELDAWKLTFVFDEQDIIFDNLPVIGYLDDMIVLGC